MVEEAFSYENEQRILDHQLGIVRTEVYCCRTNGVPVSEYKAIITGLEKIISETGTGIKLVDFGNYNLGNKPYGTPDWYQEQPTINRDRGFGRQVNATGMYTLLRREPFQQKHPHFDLMVIDKDLTMFPNVQDNNFVFGFGAYPNNIISVKRLMQTIRDPILRQKCLAVISAHEFGHNLDLVHRNFNTETEDDDYRKSHCNGRKGLCLMEQFNVGGARNIEEQTKLLIEKYNWLCPDCADEIKVKKELFKGNF